MTGVLQETFTAQRPRLLGLAYRITGSIADAEDVLQEAWLRVERTDTSDIADPTGWLVTVVSRLALDELKRAHHRREEYVGPWLPEPVPTAGVAADPADTVELAESLTLAYLQLLDVLSPAERVAFLLADVFDVPFAAVAEILDRSEASCRQLASRARRRMREAKPVATARADALFDADRFVDAVKAGDLEGLMTLLAPDVVLTSDGGPLVRAARRPVVGAERVGRFITNLAGRDELAGLDLEPRFVNHAPGAVLAIDGAVVAVVAVDVDGGRISALRIMSNPEKLSAFSAPPELV